MEISQHELIHALDRAQNSGASTPEQLAGYVFGYVGAAHEFADNSGVAQEAGKALVGGWAVGQKVHTWDDLKALPIGVVLLDREGDEHELFEDGWKWEGSDRRVPLEGSEYHISVISNYLPATIVRLPTVLPEKITTLAELNLNWPDGTRIATGDSDYDLVYTRVDGQWRHDVGWRPWGTDWCNCGSEEPEQYVTGRGDGLIVLNLGASDE